MCLIAVVFLGMGVPKHEGAVVGTTASVLKDVWTVVGGNHAEIIKKSILNDD
jgi:acetyltransferase-like isoleucine patch superfamily enzyme